MEVASSISHSGPTQDWTIEELLQWCHQSSQSQISCKTDELINTLQQVYENAEEDIWELHQLAVQNTTDEADTENIAPPDTNMNTSINTDTHCNNTMEQVKPVPSESTTSSATSETKAKSKTKKQFHNLFIEIQTGPHEGATYLLKPRSSRPCEIGRSKGRKFLQRGISLFKDSEVSTCHGKFDYKGGKMFYTDTGSTNGTCFMGEAIEDNLPMEIVSGMVLGCGDSDLKFTILED